MVGEFRFGVWRREIVLFVVYIFWMKVIKKCIVCIEFIFCYYYVLMSFFDFLRVFCNV